MENEKYVLKAQILAAKCLLSKDCIFSSLLFNYKIFVTKRKAPKAHNCFFFSQRKFSNEKK